MRQADEVARRGHVSALINRLEQRGIVCRGDDAHFILAALLRLHARLGRLTRLAAFAGGTVAEALDRLRMHFAGISSLFGFLR